MAVLMFQPQIPVGRVLDKTGAAITSPAYAYGTAIAGALRFLMADVEVTFGDPASPDITVTLEALGSRFTGVESDRPSVGVAVEHTFSVADGAVQQAKLLTNNLAAASQWRVGVKSAGAADAGDRVTVDAQGAE